MRKIFILTATLAFLPLACQAHTQTTDLQQIERKGYILSGQAQAIIDQEAQAQDSAQVFRDKSGHIFRIPQAGPPQQLGPYEDQSGNILVFPRSDK